MMIPKAEEVPRKATSGRKGNTPSQVAHVLDLQDPVVQQVSTLVDSAEERNGRLCGLWAVHEVWICTFITARVAKDIRKRHSAEDDDPYQPVP